MPAHPLQSFHLSHRSLCTSVQRNENKKILTVVRVYVDKLNLRERSGKHRKKRGKLKINSIDSM